MQNAPHRMMPYTLGNYLFPSDSWSTQKPPESAEADVTLGLTLGSSSFAEGGAKDNKQLIHQLAYPDLGSVSREEHQPDIQGRKCCSDFD
jgi:hypothetical protein